MERKKTKIKIINVRVDPEVYEKLLLCQGEWWTLTKTVEEAIKGFYYSKHKTNNLPRKMSAKEEKIKEVLENNFYEDYFSEETLTKEEQEWESYKKSLELEKMKEARRLRKGKVIDDE